MPYEPKYAERAAKLAEARWHRIEAAAETERAEHQRRLEMVRELKRRYCKHVPYSALDQALPMVRKGGGKT